MIFEEANAIVKSTDDAQKDQEAKEAFGIKYITWQACRICRHRRICKMTSPLVYKCDFLTPREDMYAFVAEGCPIVEVNEGVWCYNGEGVYECSECHELYILDDTPTAHKYHYCPNCGSRMEANT